MNVSQRLAVMSRLVMVRQLAGVPALDFSHMTNSRVRVLGRRAGLLTPRSHSNRNRNRQRRQREAVVRVERTIKRREAAARLLAGAAVAVVAVFGLWWPNFFINCGILNCWPF